MSKKAILDRLRLHDCDSNDGKSDSSSEEEGKIESSEEDDDAICFFCHILLQACLVMIYLVMLCLGQIRGM